MASGLPTVWLIHQPSESIWECEWVGLWETKEKTVGESVRKQWLHWKPIIYSLFLFSCHVSKSRLQIHIHYSVIFSQINKHPYSILCVQNSHETLSVLFEFLCLWEMHESKGKRVGFFAENGLECLPPPQQPKQSSGQSPGWAVLWEAGVLRGRWLFLLPEREKYVGMDRGGDNWPECASYNLAEAHL